MKRPKDWKSGTELVGGHVQQCVTTQQFPGCLDKNSKIAHSIAKAKLDTRSQWEDLWRDIVYQKELIEQVGEKPAKGS